MLMVFEMMGVVETDEANPLLVHCDQLSRMITNYSRSRQSPFRRLFPLSVLGRGKR
jgi:hypothetical protein